VPVSYFYDELPEAREDMMPQSAAPKLTIVGSGDDTAVEGGEADGSDPMMRRETLELVRAYYRIGDESIRRRVFDLAKALAAVVDDSD